jgi:hypothetical protein
MECEFSRRAQPSNYNQVSNPIPYYIAYKPLAMEHEYLYLLLIPLRSRKERGIRSCVPGKSI